MSLTEKVSTGKANLVLKKPHFLRINGELTYGTARNKKEKKERSYDVDILEVTGRDILVQGYRQDLSRKRRMDTSRGRIPLSIIDTQRTSYLN